MLLAMDNIASLYYRAIVFTTAVI